MNETIERGWPAPLADASANDIHDLLFEAKDYARRIHWWVRLFGVVWLSSLGVGLLVGFVMLFFAAGHATTGNY